MTNRAKNTHQELAQIARWCLNPENIERLKGRDVRTQCGLASLELGFAVKESALISAMDGLGIDRTELRAVAKPVAPVNPEITRLDSDVAFLAAELIRLADALGYPVAVRLTGLAMRDR